jgi:CBS domain-containing protein
MQESNECSPGAPAPVSQGALRAATSGPRCACREFLRSNVAAGTTLLAISTAAAGLVLLLVTLLIGADNERSIELRATQFGSWSQELGPEIGDRAASRASQTAFDNGPTTAQADRLRWIRTAAFSVTSLGLLAMAGCSIHQRWSGRRRRLENWPRPMCSLTHRHDANVWQAIRASLGANAAELLGNRLTVRQVMSATTPLASPNTSIRALKSMLAARPMSLVAICDANGHLSGVVGEVDLRRRRGTCAADVMTRDPYTAPPGARLDAAVSLMLDNQLHSLPIVENGLLRGMLTTADLMTALDCVLQAIREVSTAGVSHNTDTQTRRNQETKRFPPAPARQDEPPDTMTAPLIG